MDNVHYTKPTVKVLSDVLKGLSFWGCLNVRILVILAI